MKTRTWLALLAVFLLICLAASWRLLMPGERAASVRIYSEGKLVETVSLLTDREFTITTASGGENTITIKDGAIAVTDASCPDHYCMHRGFCTGGSSIVCLPNRLIIEFAGTQEDVDFVAG